MPIDRTELPRMLATLCSYQNWFGPCHPTTLYLAEQVGTALRELGETDRARSLLENAVRDLGRYVGRNHDLRLRALATLRDLGLAEHDYECAAAAQRELRECEAFRANRVN